MLQALRCKIDMLRRSITFIANMTTKANIYAVVSASVGMIIPKPE
jgi:hypothetical protein